MAMIVIGRIKRRSTAPIETPTAIPTTEPGHKNIAKYYYYSSCTFSVYSVFVFMYKYYNYLLICWPYVQFLITVYTLDIYRYPTKHSNSSYTCTTAISLISSVQTVVNIVTDVVARVAPGGTIEAGQEPESGTV